MRKSCKIILSMLIIIVLNIIFSYAKTSVKSAKFFNDVISCKNCVLYSTESDVDKVLSTIDEKDVENISILSVPEHRETKNPGESIKVVLVLTCFALCIIKLLYKNFKIPFDYDPNIKSKRVVYRRVRNKKFKKR